MVPPGDWESFGKSFERGEPSQDIRCSDAPVRVPMPGAKHGGSIYSIQTVLRESTFKTVATG